MSSSKPRYLISHYLGDIIYGANDGIVTTFTIVSGVQGANLSYKVLIIMGLINLLADGISMGASRFLSIRSKVQALQQSRTITDATQHGLITSTSFMVFGSIPLISFLLPGFEGYSFIVSTVVCLTTLFLAGSLRYFVNHERWWQTGIEMAVVGGSAAIIAYGLGKLLSTMV